MNSASRLARPIFAEVDSDGRLLRADEALAKLNQRAGGIEGGMLAIPALASLAQLAIRLQMRLSRAARVADDSEHLELWVEVQPEATLAKLSIVSWQVLPSSSKSTNIVTDTILLGHAGTMKFDLAHRLIRASGEAALGLAPLDFGRDGREVLTALYEGGDDLHSLLDALGAHVKISERNLKRIFDGQSFCVAGEAQDEQYLLLFDAVPASTTKSAAMPERGAPEAMFGKHLAPVLRQPLGRIIANAETIGSELQGPIRENYALYARDIANAARHLSALVDDLGDLEAVERADFRTARDDIELGDVARRVAGLLALKAADHSIRVLPPPEGQKVPAVAEFRRTLQILLNLVNNAIRYSPDGTNIEIAMENGDGFANLSVSDQGAGIAPENREKIFEKFERLGRSGDGGSGLGLYISRRLARAMGGELSVSDAAGGGAKFTLRLPNS
jgi:nitrogen-specific signal transduction histidine kinase